VAENRLDGDSRWRPDEESVRLRADVKSGLVQGASHVLGRHGRCIAELRALAKLDDYARRAQELEVRRQTGDGRAISSGAQQCLEYPVLRISARARFGAGGQGSERAHGCDA